MQTRFKSFQTFEEGRHHQAYTQRGLLPILSRYAESLWKEGGIKPVAHGAVSSCLVSHLYHKTEDASAEKYGYGVILMLQTL
jgi:hypothetical protein